MSMNLKPSKTRVRPTLSTGPGRTKQSFKDEANINNIVAKYLKTGLMDSVNKNPQRYADVSALTGYQDSLNIVRQGKELFDGLPANIKKRFQNNPAELIAFLDDDTNKDEAVKLGLVKFTPPPAAKEEPEAPLEKTEDSPPPKSKKSKT